MDRDEDVALRSVRELGEFPRRDEGVVGSRDDDVKPDLPQQPLQAPRRSNLLEVIGERPLCGLPRIHDYR